MKTKIKHNRPSRSEAERSSALMRPKGATFLKVFLGTALLAFLLIAVYFANAATTVGTNFSTDGNLTVNGNAALGDTTSDTTTVQGQTTITTLAAGLLNVLTGNLKVGNGTPGVTQDGEDGYIEGTFEVDGASQFDGAVTTNSTLTAASTAAFNGNVTIGNETTDTASVAGDLTITGTSTVNGNTALGNASTDLITLTAVLNSGVTFLKEVARTIQIADSTTTDTVGATLTVQGAAGNGTGNGGVVNVIAGNGGSTGSGQDGTGGNINITSGDAGNGNVVSSSGGDITFKIGSGNKTQVGGLTGRVLITGASAAAASHLASTQTTAAVLTVTGSGYSATSCTSCTDMRGQAIATVAASTAGTMVITFNKAYATAPICTITPADLEAVIENGSGIMYVTTSTTALTLNFRSTANGGSETWNYFCIE